MSSFFDVFPGNIGLLGKKKIFSGFTKLFLM